MSLSTRKSNRRRADENLRFNWKKSIETNKFTRSQRRILNLWNKEKGICHICKKSVPNPIQDTDILNYNNYPSRDHVFPKSIFNFKTPMNIKLAHCSCNRKKGNLLLFDYRAKKLKNNPKVIFNL